MYCIGQEYPHIPLILLIQDTTTISSQILHPSAKQGTDKNHQDICARDSFHPASGACMRNKNGRLSFLRAPAFVPKFGTTMHRTVSCSTAPACCRLVPCGVSRTTVVYVWIQNGKDLTSISVNNHDFSISRLSHTALAFAIGKLGIKMGASLHHPMPIHISISITITPIHYIFFALSLAPTRIH